MDKFIGKINGVEYANREEFYKALGALKPENVKSVSLVESSSKESNCEANGEAKRPIKSNEVATAPDKSEAFDVLMDVLGSFFKSLQNHNAPVKKDTDKNEYKTKAEQPVEHQEKAQYSIDGLIERFCFKETTYEFTGGERDELELDKFDGLLTRKAKEFSEIDWDNFDCDDLTEIREEFAERYTRAGRSNDSIVKKQHELDEKLAKYERLIEAYKDLDMPIDEAQAAYQNLQHEFDILDNKSNYYELLKHYYGELIKVIDAQY